MERNDRESLRSDRCSSRRTRFRGLKRWAVPPVFSVCFYFFAFRWCTAASSASKRERKKEREMERERQREEQQRQRETTRLDEALAACGIIKIQPRTNCWPVLPLLLPFPPASLYPFCTLPWSSPSCSSSSSASSPPASPRSVLLPRLSHLPFA